ncbi:MAG: hypothetical protein PHD04_01440 [Candidatus Pacebacteria bacterium]|nr:hypothetical protein [Candidatus Paceibacterota bacterium]
MTKKIFYAASSLIIASFAGVFIYYAYIRDIENQPLAPSNLYTSLMNTNPAFIEGEQLAKAGNQRGAVAAYEKALLLVANKLEEGQIKNKIATALAASGDVSRAITLSKEVVVDEAYGAIPRAYAARFLGQLLISPWFAAKYTEIQKEIFKDEPYKGLASSTDASVSIRNLFDYSASIYPLAYSELRSARWYVNVIFALKQKSTQNATDKEKIKEYLQIIAEKVRLADADIARVKETENENLVLPNTFSEKALIHARLTRVKESYSGMASPESVYDEALVYVRFKNMTEGEASLQYSYAIYLARENVNKKGTEINALLSDFYTSERFAQTSTMYMFTHEELDSPATKEDVRLLASIDSGFKTFLQKNGWKF